MNLEGSNWRGWLTLKSGVLADSVGDQFRIKSKSVENGKEEGRSVMGREDGGREMQAMRAELQEVRHEGKEEVAVVGDG